MSVQCCEWLGGSSPVTALPGLIIEIKTDKKNRLERTYKGIVRYISTRQ